MTAIGVLRAAYMGGLRVPQDLSVVGLDDIDFAEFTLPPLTTIRLSRADLARAAFDALRAQTEESPRNAARISGLHQPGGARIDRGAAGVTVQQFRSSRNRRAVLRVRQKADSSHLKAVACARIAATSSCVAPAAVRRSG